MAAAKNRFQKTCVICSKKFKILRNHLRTAKYCSDACSYKASKNWGSIVRNCDYCGRKLKRKPSELIHKSCACSKECKYALMRKDKSDAKGWNSVKAWMKRHGLIEQCERCGFRKQELLVIHHKDRDRKNNDLKNLEVLCPNCHAAEHLNEAKRGWRNAVTKR
jgi:hypothetical protein